MRPTSSPTSRPSSAKTSRRSTYYPDKRDQQIIAAVYTHRALTTDQIGLLFWGTVKANSRCRLHLRLLAEQKYVKRYDQPVSRREGSRPYVYFLEEGGAQLLSALQAVPPGELTWRRAHNKVEWPFLDHLLATNDLRVRLERAAPTYGFTVAAWVDDASLASAALQDQFDLTTSTGLTRRVAISPDGYFALTSAGSPKVYRAFVEADRGTESLTTWADKVAKYLGYFASDAFRKRYRARKPFRVLTVTTSDERLANLKRVTEEAGGKNWFWFTTVEAIGEPRTALFHPVWHMAGTEEPVCFPFPPTDT